MGFNPFKIIGGAVKAVAGVVKKAAPVAARVGASLIPGGSTATAVFDSVRNTSGQTATGAGLTSQARTIVAGQPSVNVRRLPIFETLENIVQFVSSTAGPRSTTGTQETQPFQSVLDKIRNDFSNQVRGVAESFGRDVARGAAQGAESEGGLPLSIRGNTPTLLAIGGLGVALVVGVVLLTR